MQKWSAWLLQKWPVLIVKKKVVADVANVAADVASAVDAAFANVDFASVEGADAGGTAPAGSQELELFEAAADGQQGAKEAEGDERRPGLLEGQSRSPSLNGPRGPCISARGRYS